MWWLILVWLIGAIIFYALERVIWNTNEEEALWFAFAWPGALVFWAVAWIIYYGGRWLEVGIKKLFRGHR